MAGNESQVLPLLFGIIVSAWSLQPGVSYGIGGRFPSEWSEYAKSDFKKRPEVKNGNSCSNQRFRFSWRATIALAPVRKSGKNPGREDPFMRVMREVPIGSGAGIDRLHYDS